MKKKHGVNKVKFKEKRDDSPYRGVSWTAEWNTQPHLECVAAMA
jgi:hypothetical protein